MNTETEYLKTIAEEIALNKNEAQETTKPNKYLATEARRLEKEVMLHLNTTKYYIQYDTFYISVMNKLVNICDILFNINSKVSPDVLVLTDLISSLKQLIPSDARFNLRLPKAFVVMQISAITDSWNLYRQQMVIHGVDEKLTAIASIPFKRFIDPGVTLYWQDFTWLRAYQGKLSIMDWENTDCNSKTEALMSLLIGREFNDDRFYVYCKKYIEERTARVKGKSARLLEYALCEKLVLVDTQTGMQKFDPGANSLSARLIKWISEEIDFVEAHERERPFSKFEFKWNVEMLAFFFKLLHERGVFGKIPLEPFSETIAANCSSIGKEDFQPATIQSRFYMKDIVVIKAIEKVLVEMLEVVRRYLR